jgi:hypothetical protein
VPAAERRQIETDGRLRASNASKRRRALGASTSPRLPSDGDAISQAERVSSSGTKIAREAECLDHLAHCGEDSKLT